MTTNENAEEWRQELAATAVILETATLTFEATAELVRQLDRLAEHHAVQEARLDDEERQNELVDRELGEIGTARLAGTAAAAKAEAIEKTRQRIADERARLKRGREGVEDVRIWQFLEKLGIAPEQVPCLNARRLAAFDHGPNTVPASELRRRAMLAAALSVMVVPGRGWRIDDAARRIAGEAKSLGLGPIDWTTIKEHRRDLRTNPARQKGRETKPTTWAAALKAIDPVPEPEHALRPSPAGPAPAGEPATAQERAQNRFDETARLAKWFFAASLGDGLDPREAAWRAAKFVLHSLAQVEGAPGAA